MLSRRKSEFLSFSLALFPFYVPWTYFNPLNYGSPRVKWYLSWVNEWWRIEKEKWCKISFSSSDDANPRNNGHRPNVKIFWLFNIASNNQNFSGRYGPLTSDCSTHLHIVISRRNEIIIISVSELVVWFWFFVFFLKWKHEHEIILSNIWKLNYDCRMSNNQNLSTIGKEPKLLPTFWLSCPIWFQS